MNIPLGQNSDTICEKNEYERLGFFSGLEKIDSCSLCFNDVENMGNKKWESVQSTLT
ncbi:hypothetical protein HanXRQr2_Chr15g0706511 [Helianthus annuus]|uniref:Uncharacterized protein n=1 Tax=Helianthus annuus TaxID=4232 RepID=A0A9K3H327_HELAN|nr:hypothetical protein HanXRQr2_Chr15g0706511 [Helianthus annuus]